METPVPTGGSYLICRTKDSRIFIFKFLSASPDYWGDIYELSQVSFEQNKKIGQLKFAIYKR